MVCAEYLCVSRGNQCQKQPVVEGTYVLAWVDCRSARALAIVVREGEGGGPLVLATNPRRPRNTAVFFWVEPTSS